MWLMAHLTIEMGSARSHVQTAAMLSVLLSFVVCMALVTRMRIEVTMSKMALVVQMYSQYRIRVRARFIIRVRGSFGVAFNHGIFQMTNSKYMQYLMSASFFLISPGDYVCGYRITSCRGCYHSTKVRETPRKCGKFVRRNPARKVCAANRIAKKWGQYVKRAFKKTHKMEYSKGYMTVYMLVWDCCRSLRQCLTCVMCCSTKVYIFSVFII